MSWGGSEGNISKSHSSEENKPLQTLLPRYLIVAIFFLFLNLVSSYELSAWVAPFSACSLRLPILLKLFSHKWPVASLRARAGCLSLDLTLPAAWSAGPSACLLLGSLSLCGLPPYPQGSEPAGAFPSCPCVGSSPLHIQPSVLQKVMATALDRSCIYTPRLQFDISVPLSSSTQRVSELIICLLNYPL